MVWQESILGRQINSDVQDIRASGDLDFIGSSLFKPVNSLTKTRVRFVCPETSDTIPMDQTSTTVCFLIF
jgi:hypothetical protein